MRLDAEAAMNIYCSVVPPARIAIGTFANSNAA
jgi:hypothetical protein